MFDNILYVMRNNTALYYILSSHYYYELLNDRDYVNYIKSKTEQEIEFFFNKRFIRHEKWFRRYLKFLTAVFVVNLLSREFERFLKNIACFFDLKYSLTAPSTLFAITEYNRNRAFFNIEYDNFIFIKDLIYLINEKVKVYCKNKKWDDSLRFFLQGNTPLGIELEFSNKGASAGKLFQSQKNDPLLNFSKYYHYHMTYFMWRFGAYIDTDIPMQQFVKKGGFLEYTFAVPDRAFKPSKPLTNSPNLASMLIGEAVKFTPIKPHSLHVTLEVNNFRDKKPYMSFNDAVFLFLCTGEFAMSSKGIVEKRIMEKNMKDAVILRKRKNEKGLVNTVEFTHMRLSRDFVRRNVYEPSLLLMIAYKNLFTFSEIFPYTKKLYDWGRRPHALKSPTFEMFERVRKGLDMEISLPVRYKNKIIDELKRLYDYNVCILKENV